MKIAALSKTSGHISRSGARRLGGAGSIADAMAGRAKNALDRYHIKRAEPCAACQKGKHSACVSLRCACPTCNPEVL